MITIEPLLDLAGLYERHRLGLVRLATLLVDDVASAEDVVQNAFVALHRNAERVRDPQAALAYLRVSVVNGSRSSLRRRQTVRKFLTNRQPDTEHGAPADSGLMLAEEHREVLAAVNTLPPRQREVLVLRYWSELSEAEIADALGITRGAVKSTASRAMDKLEHILGGTR